MKRCPQCNRVETDEALKFCRVDGATLIADSGSISGEAGTVKFGSGAVSSEAETSVLPHRSDADASRPTAPTTVLPPRSESNATLESSTSKSRTGLKQKQDSSRVVDRCDDTNRRWNRGRRITVRGPKIVTLF